MTGTADQPASLLDWATGLASDPALRSRFAQEPHAVLDEQGLADVPPADLAHSLPQVTDSVADRLGIEVDASALDAGPPLTGESPTDSLARQFGLAADAVLAGPVTPDDHDLDDHQEPISMTSGPTPAEQRLNPEHPGYTDHEWDRYTETADHRGLGGPWDVVEDVNRFSDDPFSTLYNVSGREWGPHGFVEQEPARGDTDTGIDDVVPAAAPAGPDSSVNHGDDPFGETMSGGGGSSAATADWSRFVGEEYPDEDLPGTGHGVGASPSGAAYVPHGDDPFADSLEAGRGTVHPGIDVDFGSSSTSGDGESIDSFGAGGDISAGDDVDAPSDHFSFTDHSSSAEAGYDGGGVDDVSAPEPAHGDLGAHESFDDGDAGSHDDSTDHSESFG